MQNIGPGALIGGKYKVEAEIGRGGMGFVLRAKQIVGGELVAVKVCDSLGQELLERRIKRELRVMQRMTHRNVIQILDADLDHDPPYIVMPLARGSLQDELATLNDNHPQALEAFKEMCVGVQAIHDAGVYHRDLKPANCLRMADGRIVVSDMGLAKFEERDTTVLTHTNAQIGTFAFMAPEQFRPGGSRDADARTDVCQLGKTLYYILTGLPPMLMDVSPLPTGIRHIIVRATRQQPEDRYQTVAELIDAVDLFQRSQDAETDPQAAFANLLQQVKQRIQAGQYDLDEARRLLLLLERVQGEDEASGMTAFDKLPDGLFPVLATRLPQELQTILRRYVASLEQHLSGRGFEYAETVGKRMQAVFRSTTDTDLRTLALQAVLLAATILHRFAAMTTFNRMLRQVLSEEAIPVAEMLRANLDHYKVVAGQVGTHELPMPIRSVREEATREEA